MSAPVITFLSDFGLQDDFVGTCHGVIARIAPEARVIDLTHGIPPQHVLQGALVLANTLPYMPQGVHLAVVDPGVGTERRAVAIRDGDGRLLVGPDNGLLVPAADRLGGAERAWQLANEELMLRPVSRTFHGRDVFSPAAAHLARGVDPDELGPAVAVEDLVRLDLPQPEIGRSSLRATILYVDRFGNVQLNLTHEEAALAGIAPGVRLELKLPLESYYAVATRTFAEARPRDLILYEDSYGNLAIAINGGDAARMLQASPGDVVRIAVVAE
ncbi:MAG TPA: SAM-dependent chlorinase/fluorinase [Gaiellaceae bacterium]|nr:SAM-dependent chlorinase/fluorinase [Gaiellaceae bacterium]